MPGPATPPPLALGFAGTPEFAAVILEGLLAAGRTPRVVYTQPDRPAGRGRRPMAPPVKSLALQHGLPVRQPETLRAAEGAPTLATWALDLLVVAAYGLILPPAILAVPRLGCINVHASLLPRWRGAAPVERAIMAGDTETGISIMQMDAGLDTGPVYLRRHCPITDSTDGPGLEAELARLGCSGLLECLEELPGRVPLPQPAEGATYAPKLERPDAVIDWARPAEQTHRQVRALCGRVPAFTASGEVQVSVLSAEVFEETAHGMPAGRIVEAAASGIRVACGSGMLNITRLKLSTGKGRPLSAADAVNGYGALFAVGRLLGPSGVGPGARS